MQLENPSAPNVLLRMSRGELLEQMQALYDVPSEELTADVEELLGQFRQLGIVNEVAE